MTTQNIYDMVDVWNNAGVAFTAIKMNATDTASDPASLLMDLQIGGASKFSVRKDGWITSPGQMNATQGFWGTSAAASLGLGASKDTLLVRDASDTFAMRRSTTAQAFNIYNTYTDASNYERGALKWNAGVLEVLTEGAGTGVGKHLRLKAGAATAGVYFNTNGQDRWAVTSLGHFVANSDNLYDIGVAGASRPRNIYLAGDVIAGSGATFSGSPVSITGTGYYNFTGRCRILSSATNAIRLTDNTAADFGMLQFGLTTNAAPALKKSGAGLQARLADDTDFTVIQGKLTTHGAYAAGALTPTGYVTIYDSTGTAYRVPCQV